jgi:hypothetical protein
VACDRVNPTYICIHRHTQGVSRLSDITGGGDSLGLCDKKVHINMCPISDGYGVKGIFQLPYTPSCEPRLRNQLMYWVAYRLRCKHYFCRLTRPGECGVGIRLASAYRMSQLLLRVQKLTLL